jgi:hypothetical protein
VGQLLGGGGEGWAVAELGAQLCQQRGLLGSRLAGDPPRR